MTTQVEEIADYYMGMIDYLIKTFAGGYDSDGVFTFPNGDMVYEKRHRE